PGDVQPQPDAFNRVPVDAGEGRRTRLPVVDGRKSPLDRTRDVQLVYSHVVEQGEPGGGSARVPRPLVERSCLGHERALARRHADDLPRHFFPRRQVANVDGDGAAPRIVAEGALVGVPPPWRCGLQRYIARAEKLASLDPKARLRGEQAAVAVD